MTTNPMLLTPTWPATTWHWIAARPWLALILAAVVVGCVFARDQFLAWRHRRFATGARWLTIAAPPEVTPESAAAFWTTLVGVLTPSVWRRRIYGYPHIGWEYTWTGRALSIRVWVPGTVPPGGRRGPGGPGRAGPGLARTRVRRCGPRPRPRASPAAGRCHARCAAADCRHAAASAPRPPHP